MVRGRDDCKVLPAEVRPRARFRATFGARNLAKAHRRIQAQEIVLTGTARLLYGPRGHALRLCPGAWGAPAQDKSSEELLRRCPKRARQQTSFRRQPLRPGPRIRTRAC